MGTVWAKAGGSQTVVVSQGHSGDFVFFSERPQGAREGLEYEVTWLLEEALGRKEVDVSDERGREHGDMGCFYGKKQTLDSRGGEQNPGRPLV